MGKRIKSVLSTIKNVFGKVTAPIRNNRIWKFLRRTVLRSPFRGYFKNSWAELKHVKWPDRKTSWKLTATVIAFSLVFALFTSLVDVGFDRLAKQIFLQ